MIDSLPVNVCGNTVEMSLGSYGVDLDLRKNGQITFTCILYADHSGWHASRQGSEWNITRTA